MAYGDYDSFAFFYNKYWTSATPALMEKALEPLLFAELPEGAEILDLCCGTGNNAQMMKERGYKVVGLDGSRAMLAYAGINAPEVEFTQGDARNFFLNREFHAITCLFDSVNHIIESDGLIKMFSNVYEHLREGGVFVFDVNSEQASIEAGERDFSAVEEKDVFVYTASYDKNTRITSYKITMFMDDSGSWRRNDLNILEKYYTEHELISMLHIAGFSNVRVSEGFEDLDIESFEGRIFITAWK